MASSKAELAVILAAAAVDELAEIWAWNAEHYDQHRADDYLAFLNGGTDRQKMPGERYSTEDRYA